MTIIIITTTIHQTALKCTQIYQLRQEYYLNRTKCAPSLLLEVLVLNLMCTSSLLGGELQNYGQPGGLCRSWESLLGCGLSTGL